MATTASEWQASALPFFAPGCNSATAPPLPTPPRRSPPTDAAELKQWQALIESALTTGLARLCTAASGMEGDGSRYDLHELLPARRLQCFHSASGERSSDLLRCCLDARGFLEYLQDACLIEYSCEQDAFSRRLLPAVRNLGRGMPSSIILLDEGLPACRSACGSSDEFEAPASESANSWYAQIRVLRLRVGIGDFDLAALTRPLAHPLSQERSSGNSRPAEAVAHGQSAVPTLDLKINGLSGLMCTLLADESMTIGEVKRRVATKLDIPSSQQRLLSGSRQLKDDVKLGTLHVDKDERSGNSARKTPRNSLELTVVAQSAKRAYWLQVVRARGEALMSAPAEITRDLEIVTAAVRESGFALKYAAEELKEDRQVVLAAVRKHGMALWCAADSLRADHEVALAAVQQDGLALAHVSQELQRDVEIVRTAVRKKGEALKHASADLQENRGIVLEAVLRDARALQHAAIARYADREIIYAAVQQDPRCALDRATDELRLDRGIAFAAVESHGLALQFLEPTLCADMEIVLAAVSRSGIALEFAAEQLRDQPEVVLVAVCNNGLALEFASTRLRADRHIVWTALQQDAGALRYAADHLRADRKLAEAAIKLNSFAIASVAHEVRDRELILATVQKNPSALEHATDDMFADRAFLLAVVQKSALALEYIPRHLRDDRTFMLEVVRKNGFALKYATEALRSDGEIVLAAIQQDRRALEYADRAALMAQIQKKKTAEQSSKLQLNKSCDHHAKELNGRCQDQNMIPEKVVNTDACPKHPRKRPSADAQSIWRRAVELQAAASRFLVFAQLMRGSEMDLALRSLARADKNMFMAALNACSHHLTEWASYVNQAFLAEVFTDAAEAFAMLIAFASWAEDSELGACHEENGEASRRHLGFISSALLDVGRALWLKETLGWSNVELKIYAHVDTSFEHLLILAAH